ncbi:hypothetical protein ACFE04_007348 [Oxalis oulophora]
MLRRLLTHSLSPQNPSLSSRFTPTHYLKSLFYSSTTTTSIDDWDNPATISHSISTELTNSSTLGIQDTDTISTSLQLQFSHIKPTPPLILSTLNISPDAGRTVLGFHHWLAKKPNFTHSDETLSFFVDYFGRRKDFKAIDDLITSNIHVAGFKCFQSLANRLVKAGRPTQVVGLFERMERDYGFKKDKASLKVILEALCVDGYASYAENMVKSLAHVIFPDEGICDLLIKGWCSDSKLDEARRLAGEMYRGGFEIGTAAYNDILQCVCHLCLEKDPFRLKEETDKVLVDMEVNGVPRNVGTFNVMIDNLCKLRKTQEALDLYDRMGEWGCHPNAETYLLLIRSLYLAARIGEGDEMISRMKSAGFADDLDIKAYYGFLKVLCGIQRLEHAMSVFKKMKQDKIKPGVKTYDLLMRKWCEINRVDKANVLFKQAVNNGISLEPTKYRVLYKFTKKPKAEKKEKKRETLPEKTARKRRTLTKLRLSFVKKPKKMMRRAY